MEDISGGGEEQEFIFNVRKSLEKDHKRFLFKQAIYSCSISVLHDNEELDTKNI